ncbi:MAG: site-specific DNA-methyltransferase, partial [Campylobacter sp.]|nr:site-specific DNA-methyltransferase [Campylobacter sp.]
LGWINLVPQILDKNGSIIVFCSYKFISFIAETFEKNGICVKDILVWQKSNPMPRNTTRRYVQDMEFALWGVKSGAKWIFNKPSNKPYLRSIFQTSVVAGNEKVAHPTQKSLNLMSEIIQIHTNKNDLVFDPFMGSGTTGVACANLERDFIGVEIDKEYFKIAQNRLKEFL